MHMQIPRVLSVFDTLLFVLHVALPRDHISHTVIDTRAHYKRKSFPRESHLNPKARKIAAHQPCWRDIGHCIPKRALAKRVEEVT